METINWTGNPFVDTGLAVIIARAKEMNIEINSINELTPEIIKIVTLSKWDENSEDMSWLINLNKKLNSYTMIFSSNNPLTQPSTNKKTIYENNIKKTNSIKELIRKNNFEINSLTSLNESKSSEINEIKTKMNEIGSKSKEEIKEFKKIISNNNKVIKENEKKIKTKNAQNKKFSKKIDVLNIKVTRTDPNVQDTGINEYKKILKSLVEEINNNEKNEDICEATGIKGTSNTLMNFGKFIGKEWFPLVGSKGDIQTLPGGSRSIKLSALSLLSVQFLPIGVGLLGKRLCCFQSSDYSLFKIPIFQLMVEDIYSETVSKSKLADKVETWGKGGGYSSMALLLLGQLQNLCQHKYIRSELPNWICLNIWLFSNSGQEPYLEIIEIPNNSLQFLWTVWRSELKEELEMYLKLETSSKYKLLECIKNNKEYYPFYYINEEIILEQDNISEKLKSFILQSGENYFKKNKQGKNYIVIKPIDNEFYLMLENNCIDENEKNKIKHIYNKSQFYYNGASVKLLDLYNIQILYYSENALIILKWLSSKLKLFFNKKDFEVSLKNLKKIFIKLIDEGFTLEHYLILFPSSIHPLCVEPKRSKTTINILKYYLKNLNNNNEVIPMIDENSKYKHPLYDKVKIFASDFFDYYIKKEGEDRFKKRILNKIKSDQIYPKDLKTWFIQLADIKEGYTNDDWDDLCRDENGDSVVWELIFQMKLELLNLYRKNNFN